MPTVIHELADAFLRRKQALAERSQAKTKLAGSDYFMPKSAKQDLANRLSVFEQGGLPELLKQGASEMYHNPIVNTAIGAAPGASDLQAGYEFVKSLQEGRPWYETAAWGASALPGVPTFAGMVAKNDAKALTDIANKWESKGVILDAYPSKQGKELNVSRIVVPKEARGQGVGSEVMQELVDTANANKQTMTLSPSTDFGATSVNRLKEFYKRFGFVENKGKNKDFSISESMYRLPD